MIGLLKTIQVCRWIAFILAVAAFAVSILGHNRLWEAFAAIVTTVILSVLVRVIAAATRQDRAVAIFDEELQSKENYP